METSKRDGPYRQKARTLSVEVLEDRLLLSLATLFDYAISFLPTAERSSNQPLLAIVSSHLESDDISNAPLALEAKLLTDLRATEAADGGSAKPGAEYASPVLEAIQAALGPTVAAYFASKAMTSSPATGAQPAESDASDINPSGHGQIEDAVADRYEQALQREAQRLAEVSYNLVAEQPPNAESERAGPVALTPAPQPSIPGVSPPPPAGIPPAGLDADRPARTVAVVRGPVAAPEPGNPPPLEAVVPEDSTAVEPSQLFALADGRQLIQLPVQLALPVQAVLPMDLHVVEQAADAFFAQLDNLSPQRDDWRSPTHLSPWTIVATAVLFECLRRWEKKSTRRPGPWEGVPLGLADVPGENEA